MGGACPQPKTGGRVASLTPDLFYRTKNGGTNQIAVFKWLHHYITSQPIKRRHPWHRELVREHLSLAFGRSKTIHLAHRDNFTSQLY